MGGRGGGGVGGGGVGGGGVGSLGGGGLETNLTMGLVGLVGDFILGSAIKVYSGNTIFRNKKSLG